MAASAGSGSGGSALIPVIGAAVLGVPVIAVMALAFSDFNLQVDNANSKVEADVDRPAPASHGAPLGSFVGVGGASKGRLNLLGRASPPAPRPAEEVDVRIAPLLAEAFGRQTAGEETPSDAAGADVVLTETPADGAPGRMAMLQSGGQNWGAVQGGGGSSGAGWSGFGGGPGFGGSGGGSGFGGGGSQGGSMPQALAPTPPPGALTPTGPAPQPPIASLTPPPAPPSQPPAAPASPPASGSGPIVLGPGDVLKGDGSTVPVINDGGQLAGGHSPGEWDGLSYVQEAGETEVEIWGLTSRGVDYDYYDIAGDAIFNGGTIAFEFLDGFDFSQAFELEFLSAGDIEFGLGFDGYTFRYATLGLLDFDDLFDVFELVDDSGRERLVLSYFGPQQQQVNNPQQNQVAQTPEPEVLFLFGLGLLGLAAARRRLA